MRKYQKLYDDAATKRESERKNYAQIQFSSEDIKKKDYFKKIRRDIWYFYLVAIVVVAIVLLIISTKKSELFTKIWLTYIFILSINTIFMAISIGIIKQVIENKAIKARKQEENIMKQAENANLFLAKLCIVLLVLDDHASYLNKVENKALEMDDLVQKYIKIVSENLNNYPTCDEIINFYRNILVSREIKG